MDKISVPHSLPVSLELAEFQSYSKTALPILIEANLRAATESQLRPIEDELKETLMDTVRRCLSMVTENFKSMKRRSSKMSDAQRGSKRDSMRDVEASNKSPGKDLGLSDLTTSVANEESRRPEHKAHELTLGNLNGIARGTDQDNAILRGFDGGSHLCACVCHVFSQSGK